MKSLKHKFEMKTFSFAHSFNIVSKNKRNRKLTIIISESLL